MTDSGTATVGAIDLGAVLLILILTLFGLASIVVGAFFRRRGRFMAAWLSAVGFIAACAVCAVSIGRGERAEGFGGVYVLDDFTFGLVLPCAISGLLTVLLGLRFLRGLRHGAGELCGLLLLATAGMAVMAGAQDLIVGFFGLELMSIPLYVLAGYSREDRRSNEAGLKYLMIGSVSSAVMIYGLALVYAAFGTANLAILSHSRLSPPTAPGGESLQVGLAATGMALTVVGLAFKAALAPFHMWCPDVYEGSATPITAFLSVGPKIAALGLLFRALLIGFGPLAVWWLQPVAVLSALSMTVGNLGALQQTKAKRMLAYSSIAHAGYMLMAVVAGGAMQVAGASGLGETAVALVFYALAYAFMGVGAFAVVSKLCRDDRDDVDIDRFRGLAANHPWSAGGLALFMISLTGIPITAGFFAKAVLFLVAADAGVLWLVVVAALNSVVSAFYYLRPVALTVMHEEDDDARAAWAPTAGASWVMILSAGGVVLLAFFPRLVLDAASALAKSIVP